MIVPVLLALLFAGLVFMPDNDSASDEDSEIKGTFGDDEITGTEGDDVIHGWRGDDEIDGLGGNDEIRAGEGDDGVNGGNGIDEIYGGPGEDDLRGGLGNDRLFGGADDDVIDGGYGSDIIRGGNGDDTIFGGFDARLVDDELVPADATHDRLHGDDGNDTIFIWGGDGEGAVNGGDGDDRLVAVTGEADLTGGAGDNAYFALANEADDKETLAAITDFDPFRDTLTLTVDGVLTGADEPAVDFALEETEIDGVSGVLVSAVIAGGDANVSDSEGAGAFLHGLTVADLASAVIEVEFTQEADIFDPEVTLAALV